MTSGCQPNQVHSAIVKRSIPVRIIPDVVSSSPSEAVAYSMPSTVWDVRLQELTIYKKQNNGKTNVPHVFPSNKQLGIWVNNQRRSYKLFKANENSSMTPERIESLNELDFKWVVISITGWEDHLQELTIYKQENNGSTNVPRLFPSNQPLGNWVMTQRHQYKLFEANKKSAMTKERIESLNKLDFEWSTPRKGNTTTSATWDDRLQELTIYKQPSTVWDVRLL
jgi:glutaredoxin